jgi:hypothetical protein
MHLTVSIKRRVSLRSMLAYNGAETRPHLFLLVLLALERVVTLGQLFYKRLC